MSSGKYKAAEAAFNKMSGYLDASERAKQAAVLWSAAQALAAGNVETMRKILNNPVISCLSATKQMEGDLQVLEESIKQELDSGVELEKLKQERSIVYKRCANLREHAVTPVPSQIERDESADAAAQIRQALGQLGMFDFKARRDLSEQLQKEIARHNACIQRIPVEIEERKKEVEKEKEGLDTREAVLEKQIALQNRLIEDARSRLSELKRKYSCADHD